MLYYRQYDIGYSLRGESMAKTVYIRDDDREKMGRNKPPSWPLVDYLGFLASLHDEMDQIERAQREYDYQQYLVAKDRYEGRQSAIRQADAEKRREAE
jgi:hypothetical protein